jgi:hypothetical protein
MLKINQETHETLETLFDDGMAKKIGALYAPKYRVMETNIFFFKSNKSQK